MYISRDLFEKFVTFIDIDDIQFFKEAIEAARYQFETISVTDDLERIKKKGSPVIYASTVSAKKTEDELITRKELNKRARRRFIMIDVDLNADEKFLYDKVRNGLIELADEHNAPLLIYPTLSYPEKPRFRAVLFTKNLMDKGSYHQAVSWLYDQLDVPVLDASDLNMSNNNAPLFVNEEQIKAIYSNLDDEDRELLVNQWKEYPKPEFTRAAELTADDFKKYEKDEVEISDFVIDYAIEQVIKRNLYTDYQDFWKLNASLVRAEYFGQITEEQAFRFLEGISKVAQDVVMERKWSEDNKRQFQTTKDNLTEEDLAKTKLLINVDIFRDALNEEMIQSYITQAEEHEDEK